MSQRSPLRVGIGGPVGSGKTALTLNYVRPCVKNIIWLSSPMTFIPKKIQTF